MQPVAEASGMSTQELSDVAPRPGPHGSCPEVFAVFLRLGLTSFGGPVAHLGYFRDEFVVRRRWLDDRAYADLVALCQFLPGPASSQVGISIGLSRAGYLGALAAWTGFTLPSAIALVALRLWRERAGRRVGGWLAARAQGRRRRRRRAGGAGHDALARTRPRARDHGGRRGHRRVRAAERLGPGGGDRAGRDCRAPSAARRQGGRACRLAAAREPHDRSPSCWRSSSRC